MVGARIVRFGLGYRYATGMLKSRPVTPITTPNARDRL